MAEMGRHPAGHETKWPWGNGRGRRCTINLFVSRRNSTQTIGNGGFSLTDNCHFERRCISVWSRRDRLPPRLVAASSANGMAGKDDRQPATDVLHDLHQMLEADGRVAVQVVLLRTAID